MFTGSLIVAVENEKGGVGKSSVSVGLAMTAAKVGESVLVIDLDQQANAANWGDRFGQGKGVTVLATVVGRLRVEIEKARADGYDLIIIDTPGKNSDVAIVAAKLADLVLIPCRPLVFDMEGLPTCQQNIQAAQSPPAYVVWNCIHPSAVKAPKALKENTAEISNGLAACPVHLTQQNEHADTQATGAMPTGRAAEELQSLYLFVRQHQAKGAKHDATASTTRR